MIKKFSGKAIYKATNKSRKFNIVAIDENELIRRLVESGYAEPWEFKEVINSPTEKQLEYAKDLKIKIPKDATMEDLSALISRVVDKDSLSPNTELLEFTLGRIQKAPEGFYISKYIGKKSLYNHLFHWLPTEDRIAFFAFCIYRSSSNDRSGNLDKHPYKDIFYKFAHEQIKNEKFIKSLNDNYQGKDLRFFGKIKFNDGEEVFGGSTTTLAYKTCDNFLKLNIPEIKPIINKECDDINKEKVLLINKIEQKKIEIAKTKAEIKTVPIMPKWIKVLLISSLSFLLLVLMIILFS